MLRIIAQVFADNENHKGCPSRSDMPETETAKGAQRCSSPGSGIGQTALSPEKRSTDARARACGGQ